MKVVYKCDRLVLSNMFYKTNVPLAMKLIIF